MASLVFLPRTCSISAKVQTEQTCGTFDFSSADQGPSGQNYQPELYGKPFLHLARLKSTYNTMWDLRKPPKKYDFLEFCSTRANSPYSNPVLVAPSSYFGMWNCINGELNVAIFKASLTFCGVRSGAILLAFFHKHTWLPLEVGHSY